MSQSQGGHQKGPEHDIKIQTHQVTEVLKASQDKVNKSEQNGKNQCQEKPQQVVSQSVSNQQQDYPKQPQKTLSNPDQLLKQQKLTLKTELQSMQFQPYLIQQAIQNTSNLDQAIQFIINKIQSNEKQHLGISKEVKLFFIVRMDLKMGTGKIAAQVGHAALRAFQNIRYSSSNNDNSANLLIEWMQNGQKNKILQAETQNDLQFYLNLAGNKYINNCYIRDAGRTQIAAGSMTVAAIGPVRQCDADFLKNLKDL